MLISIGQSETLQLMVTKLHGIEIQAEAKRQVRQEVHQLELVVGFERHLLYDKNNNKENGR